MVLDINARQASSNRPNKRKTIKKRKESSQSQSLPLQLLLDSKLEKQVAGVVPDFHDILLGEVTHGLDGALVVLSHLVQELLVLGVQISDLSLKGGRQAKRRRRERERERRDGMRRERGTEGEGKETEWNARERT